MVTWCCTELLHGISEATAAHFYPSPVQMVALAHTYDAGAGIFRSFSTYLSSYLTLSGLYVVLYKCCELSILQ